jgi:hypothetical protein
MWEETAHSNLTLFKPGIYWNDSTRERIRAGSDPRFKARGISAQAFGGSISTIDSAFARWPDRYPHERDPDGPREGWFPAIEFQSGFSMVTPLQALQRRKWDTCGSVSDITLRQDADPVEKRHSGYFQDGIYWSQPHRDGGPVFESTPYSKDFGSSPDPEEYGITDDGTVKNSWQIWKE